MHLSRLFQRTVRMHGARPALTSGTVPPIDYAELDRRVRRLAHWLRHDRQLAPGERVAVLMKNCTEYAEALLAIWTAGLCAVPVNAKLHPQEVAYVLMDSGAKACVGGSDMLAALAPALGPAARVDLLDAHGPAWRTVAENGEPPVALLDVLEHGKAEDFAWLFYTSGTTGRPKGVMLTHANMVMMALNFFADVQGVGPQDALVHVAPMSHGGGLYGIAYMIQGGLQVVAASGGFDEAELLGLLHHYRKASLFAAPTIVGRLVTHVRSLELPEGVDPCPGLRNIITGGAPFYVEDIKAAVHTFGPRISQVYGQGESPMTISALKADALGEAVRCGDESLLASVGYAQTTVDIAILDEQGSRVPQGATGEVTLRSPSVMHGYWNNPEATAQTIRDHRLYTGDRGLLDERGLLHLKDRSKDVIISGGTNIYPREVEEVLLRHPGVREVSVIGLPDAEWGESVAAVVVRDLDSTPADADALDALCIDNIARFKRPKQYLFMDELPKNATGKVLKQELRNLVAQGVLKSNDRKPAIHPV